MQTNRTAPPRRRRWPWLAGGAAGVVLVAVAVLAASAWSWGQALREEQRLLPGATIAGVDVGDVPAAAALERVREVVDPDLDRVVTVVHDDRAWEVSARDLGGTTDADQVVAAALDRTLRASMLDLARIRWSGPVSDLALDVVLHVGDDEAASFVAGIADDLEREPVDARLDWNGDAVELSESVDGLRVERDRAVAELRAALTDGHDTLQLPVEVLTPAVTTAAAEAALPAVEEAVEARLDRVVTLGVHDRTWEVTPRELGASPDIESVATAALAAPVMTPTAAGGEGDLEVPLSVPDDAIESFVERIASDVDVSARNADVRWAGRVEVTPERTGRALDRTHAAEQLTGALRGERDRVDLEVSTVQPAVTAASFREVLVVRQDARVLERHVDGRVTHSWPVAVGQGGAETPTGVFTVGQKRFEPTWYNPSPDGWGADMPEVIGPGPDNPLGLRALNWNRNGADTLIRFHGTPNEASIGEAASRGCVRMFNRDVIELYDLVSSGTTILSVRD